MAGVLQRLFWRDPPPPWEKPRALWHGDLHFFELMQRLDETGTDPEQMKTYYRDRETGQRWVAQEIEGGPDSYPGTLPQLSPLTEEH